MRGSWRIRRRIIIATLLFCASILTYLTGWGQDTKLAETLATGAFLLMGSTIGSYVFGAVWQDVSMPMHGRRRERTSTVETDIPLSPDDDEDPTKPPPGYAT